MYLEKLRLDGQVAVVVGAGGGRMGTETVVALAEAGAAVAGVDLYAERLTEVQEKIAAAGGSFLPLQADVMDHAAFPRALDQAWRELGPVQHLVHVVGGNRPAQFREGAQVAEHAGFAMLDAYTDERFEAVVEFNLLTTFRACRDFARRLIDARLPGTIVVFSSIAGLNGSPGIGAYGAAKAAVISLAQTMAVELGPHGIRVNAVAPGQTRSGIVRPGTAFVDADLVDPARYPAGAPGVGDIAATVLYLSTDLSASVTGQTIAVDGGATSRLPIFSIAVGEAGVEVTTR
jgi:3-oxoacyl-[acyl-carrier protein] reductase